MTILETINMGFSLTKLFSGGYDNSIDHAIAAPAQKAVAAVSKVVQQIPAAVTKAANKVDRGTKNLVKGKYNGKLANFGKAVASSVTFTATSHIKGMKPHKGASDIAGQVVGGIIGVVVTGVAGAAFAGARDAAAGVAEGVEAGGDAVGETAVDGGEEGGVEMTTTREPRGNFDNDPETPHGVPEGPAPTRSGYQPLSITDRDDNGFAPGDRISTPLRGRMGRMGFRHHGIISDTRDWNGNYTVLDNLGDTADGDGGAVAEREMSREEAGLYDRITPARNPARVVGRMRSLIGRSSPYSSRGYSAVARNCDHAAEYAATGAFRSYQIERTAAGAALAGIGVIGGTVGGVLGSRKRSRSPGSGSSGSTSGNLDPNGIRPHVLPPWRPGPNPGPGPSPSSSYGAYGFRKRGRKYYLI